MDERNLGNLFSDWLRERRHEGSVENFALKKYLEFHKDDSEEISAKTECFQRRTAAWKDNMQGFESFAKGYSVSSKSKQGQTAEMLDNVIAVYRMEQTEQYRFLSNVKMMVYYRLSKLLDDESGKQLKDVTEREYEAEWEKAENGITDNELQDMFAETVSLMRYAGIAYNDETRKVLADIGVGRDAEFKEGFPEEAEWDMRFLTNFLLSEMIALDSEEKYTKEEQEIITEQVVPVCVSSAAMVQKGADANRVMKLAKSYLGQLLSNKNLKILGISVTIFAAAKVLFFLCGLALMGTVTSIGINHLWMLCKEKLGVDVHENNSFFPAFLASKIKKKLSHLKSLADREDNGQIEKWKEFVEEKEFENA